MFRIFSWLPLFLLFVAPLGASAQGPQGKPATSPIGLEIHGFIKADGIFETNGQGAITLFAPNNSEDLNRTTFTLRQSRLKFHPFVRPKVLGANVTGALEADFYGGGKENKAIPRLYRAFIKAAWPSFHLLIGQDWDTNSKLYGNTLVFTLPPVGNVQFRRFQARGVYSPFTFDDSGLSFEAALAQGPQEDLDGNGVPDGDDFAWPMVQGRVAFEKFQDKEGKGFAHWKHQTEKPPTFVLAISAHYGGEEVDWEGPGSGERYDTWSLSTEVCVPIGEHVSLKGEAFTGCNLDHAYGGIVQGINPETRQEIHASGGWGQVQVTTKNKKLQFHVGGGLDQPREEDLSEGDRSKNMAFYANVFYSLAKAWKIALEEVHYETDYLGGDRATNDRVQFSAYFIF